MAKAKQDLEQPEVRRICSSGSGYDMTSYIRRYTYKNNRCQDEKLKLTCNVLERLRKQAARRTSSAIEQVRAQSAGETTHRQGFRSYTSSPFTSMTYDAMSNWRLTPIPPVSLSVKKNINVKETFSRPRSTLFLTRGKRPMSTVVFGEGHRPNSTYHYCRPNTTTCFPIPPGRSRGADTDVR